MQSVRPIRHRIVTTTTINITIITPYIQILMQTTPERSRMRRRRTQTRLLRSITPRHLIIIPRR
ncbi:hypothetical protein Hanom_Chr07g00587501 [Helianthus anomalus]